MNQNSYLIVNVNISAEAYLSYYQGAAKNIKASSEEGKTVIFPASALRQFVTHNGINGRFKIFYDNSGKLKTIEQI